MSKRSVGYSNKERSEIGYGTEGYGKIYAGNIVTWAIPKLRNSRAEWSEGNDRGILKIDVSAGVDTLKSSQTTGEPVQLSCDIQETRNDQAEDWKRRW